MGIGVALYAAQQGYAYPAAKPMKGFGGASVLEIVSDYRGDTWRAIYTIRFREAVYVLHVFQKKSKRGIATPRQEIEVINAAWPKPSACITKGRTDMRIKTSHRIKAKKSSGNIFADLGLRIPSGSS